MKNYLKKAVSSALLPAMFAGYIGINKINAGENDYRVDKTIALENSDNILFSYSEKKIELGTIVLEAGKNYKINPASYISKPDLALDIIIDYVNAHKDNYMTRDGVNKISESEKRLEDIKAFTNDANDKLIAEFEYATRDGILSQHDIFSFSSSGDIYVTDKRMSVDNDELGDISRGVIVRIKPDLVYKVKELKPGMGLIQEETLKKNGNQSWFGRHKVTTTLLGILFAGAVAKYLSNNDEPKKNPNGDITGGNEF